MLMESLCNNCLAGLIFNTWYQFSNVNELKYKIWNKVLAMSIFYTGCTMLLSLMSLLIVILLTSTCIQIHSCDINLSVNDKHFFLHWWIIGKQKRYKLFICYRMNSPKIVIKNSRNDHSKSNTFLWILRFSNRYNFVHS